MSKKTTTLSAGEQARLVARAQAGDRAAMNLLASASMGLMRQIAYDYARVTPGVEVDDLTQEGAFAFLDAVKWFREERGFCFSTYLGDCVRRRLWKWLQREAAVRIGQEPPDKDGDNPLEMFSNAPSIFTERHDELRKCVEALTRVQRRVVVMRTLNSGWGEIAKSVGLAVSEVQKMYEEALQAMRRTMESNSN